VSRREDDFRPFSIALCSTDAASPHGGEIDGIVRARRLRHGTR
jgi:hypothetical protein